MVVPKAASRGIAVCLPAKRISQFGVLLAELRERGCKLLVVVYHYKGEYSAADIARINGFGKRTRVAQIVEDARFEQFHVKYLGIDHARVKGFACKPLALMQAPFQQVMLVSHAFARSIICLAIRDQVARIELTPHPRRYDPVCSV